MKKDFERVSMPWRTRHIMQPAQKVFFTFTFPTFRRMSKNHFKVPHNNTNNPFKAVVTITTKSSINIHRFIQQIEQEIDREILHGTTHHLVKMFQQKYWTNISEDR